MSKLSLYFDIHRKAGKRSFLDRLLRKVIIPKHKDKKRPLGYITAYQAIFNIKEEKKWDRRVSNIRPMGYFIQYKMPEILSNIYYESKAKVKSFIKYGVLNDLTKVSIKSLKKNRHYDSSEIMTHACFQVLVNFVEKDLVNYHEKRKKKRCKDFRCGLKELEFLIRNSEAARMLDVAKAMMEAKDLYIWWKFIYPNRLDPYGTDRIWKDDADWSESDELAAFSETFYFDELQRNLERLMKIRNYLWI